MPNEETYIPDSSGTIFVKGHESAVQEFTRRKIFCDMLVKEVDAGKVAMRNLAQQALAKAAEGAKRVCILGGDEKGVSTTLPDYEKESNRTAISDANYKKFQKAGGEGVLEIPESELFEVTNVAGSKSLVLTGKWFTWFHEQYVDTGKLDIDKEEDLNVVTVEPSTTRRLSYKAIARLKVLTVMGSAKAKKAAELLLDAGLKAMAIRVD